MPDEAAGRRRTRPHAAGRGRTPPDTEGAGPAPDLSPDFSAPFCALSGHFAAEDEIAAEIPGEDVLVPVPTAHRRTGAPADRRTLRTGAPGA